MKCINYRCLEHYDKCEENGCHNFNNIEDCDCVLTAQKDPVADKMPPTVLTGYVKL